MSEQQERKSPIIPVLESTIPNAKTTKVTVDDSFARIIVYEKEDLSNDEIFILLNIRTYTKMDIDKHYVRSKDGIDQHSYTIYNILI
ncbi:hypothetical protein GGR21_001423 [Dysgonomonas hofstadii]|uniref:Uncharacterized protein n=1 Tax=Dysgonomonas hofstadii TaxID=637886 RepID=A0A840CHU1_9BACT|nr:hypothetical protein [Dysgonomonas hofstadii]MBB4035530.1 hypothetical protein [Dysgonomonas hofstadii]